MELLNAVGNGLLVGIVLLVVLTVLVAVHELGHYWFAKLCGMHVEAFAVMVGGVRKTDLSGRLTKKLVPASWLWGLGSSVSVLTFLAAFFEQRIAFFVGMGLLTVVGPVWVISRLSALYHRPLLVGLRTLAICWMVVLAIIGLGTGFRFVDPGYVISMFFGGSATAVLLLYYAPVLGAQDMEGNKGRGSIEVEGTSVPVRFRPLASWTNKEGTEFSMLLLPLGGFAAIKGMLPREDASEMKIEKGFFSRPPSQRLLVLFAGPLFSILLGIALLFAGFLGQGEPVQTTRVASAVDAAAKAGLKEGDKITAINGQPVSTFYEMVSKVRYSFKEEGDKRTPVAVLVAYERDGVTKEVSITPKVTDTPVPVLGENGEPTAFERYQARIGISPESDFKPISAQQAFNDAVSAPVSGTVQLFKVFTNFETAKESVGGPTVMVEQTSQAVKYGFWMVLIMAGSLSVMLGIMNLLPIPPLDGGQMVIAFIEMLRGNKRLSLTIQNGLHQLGFFAVMGLMLAAFAIDAGRRAEAGMAAMKAESSSASVDQKPKEVQPKESAATTPQPVK
ncbi:MAG: M50 family metallopeptidase [Armatimonadetes bacterium]|nr:M50 family metallopeptidase [Armatimonadota bacterium]